MKKSNFTNNTVVDDFVADLKSKAAVVMTKKEIAETEAKSEAELAETEAELAELEAEQKKKEKKENMIKYISIGIGVLALGYLAYAFYTKKK